VKGVDGNRILNEFESLSATIGTTVVQIAFLRPVSRSVAASAAFGLFPSLRARWKMVKGHPPVSTPDSLGVSSAKPVGRRSVALVVKRGAADPRGSIR
jgi:hypothetical protein